MIKMTVTFYVMHLTSGQLTSGGWCKKTKTLYPVYMHLSSIVYCQLIQCSCDVMRCNLRPELAPGRRAADSMMENVG